VKHLILAALHALTPSALDVESPAARCTRLEPIAQAIDETCRGDIPCAAALIALGQVESRFAERVQAGRCRRFECDRGRSRGVFQINITAVDSETWAALGRYDNESLRIGAREAIRIWRYGLSRCGGNISCARSRYRGARAVSEADRALARRVVRLRRVLAGGEL
jgi:hypothetical protein